MRFSLQDVKKSIHRRGGELTLSLHFLHESELLPEIGRLITYYERLLGQSRRHFVADEARTCIGDYRLANCMIATLSHWYSWQSPDWQLALQRLDASDALAQYESSAQLRQALYSYVNEQYHGFLDSSTRLAALQDFAGRHGLTVIDLEYLLALDSDEEACLVRNVPHAPRPQDVAKLYNQWTFEAALGAASAVHFTIDCAAFVSAQHGTTRGPHSGAGAVIKRLCTLTRHLGVYYDLAYEHTLLNEQSPATLLLTLYGPQEMTGVPQQYGLRLARLCRLLLGYGTAKEHVGKHLINAITEACATVHFLQRSYQFFINKPLLQLLPGAEQASSASPVAAVFDSSVERQFAAAFSGLASSDGIDGWTLEREPEPLLLDRSIFIPDFALTRASRRIYVEIVGFWTPAYRERKIQKLQQLQGRNDILLAIPLEAKASFASIVPFFPIIWYQGQLSAREVVQVLRDRYDDFAERLEDVDSNAVRAKVRREGIVPEVACYALLHCYRRTELQQAVQRVIEEDIQFMPGVGLYRCSWAEQIQQACAAYLQHTARTTLDELALAVRDRWPQPDQCSTTALEMLLATWSNMRVSRDSIFDAVVELVGEQHIPVELLSEPPAKPPSPGPSSKRSRAPAKKKRAATVVQDGLWE